MILLSNIAKYLILFEILLVAGCANIARLDDQVNSKETSLGEKSEIKTEFRGRLALRVEAQTPQDIGQGQSFSGSFELTGNAQTGTLLLFSPLGSTVAALYWAPGVAQLESGGSTRQFESLGAMLQNATGAELPIAGLFSWLNGRPANATGWSADLSRWSDGRITAQRSSPSPKLELRIILD